MNSAHCVRLSLLSLLLLACSACRSTAPPAPVIISGSTNPATAAALAEPRSFFADPRARQPGDMLTVIITEAASVAQTARTQSDKAQSLTGKYNRSANDQVLKSGEIDSHYVPAGASIERKGQEMLGQACGSCLSLSMTTAISPSWVTREIFINNERQYDAPGGRRAALGHRYRQHSSIMARQRGQDQA